MGSVHVVVASIGDTLEIFLGYFRVWLASGSDSCMIELSTQPKEQENGNTEE